VARRVRASRILHRLLFGYLPLREGREKWDWTTLVLCKGLRRHARPKMKVLDMGTGPVAVLAIYARKHLGCADVSAVDYSRSMADLAAKQVKEAGLDIPILCGDLFSPLNERCDLIVFNAPYISLEDGDRLGVFKTDDEKQRWCGGPTGLETITRFLEAAPGHLNPGGVVLLGFNRFFLPARPVENLLVRLGYQTVEVVRLRGLPSCAYAVRPGAEGRGEKGGDGKTGRHGP
jgi:methylase of polypeptide subunit release factors